MVTRRNKDSKIRIATLEPGVAGVLETRLIPVARSAGIEVQVLENNDFDDFVSLLSEGKVEAAVVPANQAYKLVARDIVRSLFDDFYDDLRGEGIPPYAVDEDVFGIEMSRLDSVFVLSAVCDGDRLKEILRELLRLLKALFCDGETPVKPIDKNTFEWEIAGPDTVPVGDPPKCVSEEYTVRYKAENAKIRHILWNKQPPAGGKSVERTAVDDEGDHPKDKQPSFSSLDRGTWKVPFCSRGEFLMTVTVVWECLLDRQVHTERKQKTITAA